MHRLMASANFIHANMPFGTTYESPVLSEDDAWDVAAYINAQPRPGRAPIWNAIIPTVAKESRGRTLPALCRSVSGGAAPPRSFPADPGGTEAGCELAYQPRNHSSQVRRFFSAGAKGRCIDGPVAAGGGLDRAVCGRIGGGAA